MNRRNLGACIGCALLALTLSTAACGSDDDTSSGGSSSSSCTGSKLTDEQLCGLTCGTTTFAGAQATLGKPSASSGTTLLQYTYSCTAGTTASALSWDFFFDNDKLREARVTGIGTFAGQTAPACLANCKL